MNKYKIYKENIKNIERRRIITQTPLPEIRDYKKNSIDKISTNKLKKFKKTVECNPNFDLTYFYNNMDTLISKYLRLSLKKHKLKLYNADGMYLIVDNELLFTDKGSVYHELFHLLSSTYDSKKKKVYSGFSQGNRRVDIGVALNEGYTELLSSRYFGNENTGVYPIEVQMAILIEKIVGESTMEKLYSEANLEGLIDEIDKYANDRKSILNTLIVLDRAHDLFYFCEETTNNVLALEECLNAVTPFLLQCYLEKAKNDNSCNVKEFLDLIDICLQYENLDNLTISFIDKESIGQLLDNYNIINKRYIK